MTNRKAATSNPDNTVQVIKEASNPTTSGKSTLGYQVGVDEAGEILLRISKADGGGFYSGEWVRFADIQEAFRTWPEDTPITSMTLRPLFRGKSVNTPGFLVAVLCAEGLLEPMPDRQRVHRACDPARFLDSIEELRKKAGITPPKKNSANPKTKTPASPKAKAKASTKAKAVRKTR